MIFRRYTLFLLLLVCLCRLQAQDDEWVINGGAGYASERVFRGVERSGAAAQGSVEVAGAGFRGNLWSSQPFQRGEPGETDLNAGYDFKVSDQLVLAATATQFFYSGSAPGATRQSTEAGLQATWTAQSGLKPSVAYFHDFRLETDTVEVATGYDLALRSLGAYLELKAFAGWVTGANVRPDSAGPRVRDAYTYFGADAQVPYRVGAHTTLVAGVHFSDAIGQSRLWSPISAPGGVRTWVSVAVKFDF